VQGAGDVLAVDRVGGGDDLDRGDIAQPDVTAVGRVDQEVVDAGDAVADLGRPPHHHLEHLLVLDQVADLDPGQQRPPRAPAPPPTTSNTFWSSNRLPTSIPASSVAAARRTSPGLTPWRSAAGRSTLISTTGSVASCSTCASTMPFTVASDWRTFSAWSSSTP